MLGIALCFALVCVCVCVCVCVFVFLPFWRCCYLAFGGESWSVCFLCVCLCCACWIVSLSCPYWYQVVAAACDCHIP